MVKKIGCFALIACLILGLTACAAEEQTVLVERVDMLTAVSVAQDRYAGVVVSENVTNVSRDMGKSVKEVYVSEGDDVLEGQILFSYDSEELQLELDKQNLELERLKNTLSLATTALSEAEKKMDQLEKGTGIYKNMKDDEKESIKLTLSVEINAQKSAKLEAGYNVTDKQKEIANLKDMLQDVNVVSPVEGRIRKIDDQSESYITIQKTGAYRVKGTLNELSMAGGINVGAAVRVISRVNEDQTWTGVVSLVDMENPDQGGNDGYYFGYNDPMTSSSSYPFYIELDSTDGLRMGQHVYIQAEGNVQTLYGTWVPESYLMDVSFDEETYQQKASVWVAGEDDKLTKRQVVLGMLDDMLGAYEILEGLTEIDYLANPADSACEEGARVEYRIPADLAPAPAPDSYGPVWNEGDDDFGENGGAAVDLWEMPEDDEPQTMPADEGEEEDTPEEETFRRVGEIA